MCTSLLAASESATTDVARRVPFGKRGVAVVPGLNWRLFGYGVLGERRWQSRRCFSRARCCTGS
eukprot:967290-Lingulodinium_polyedra.AAC.1